MIEREVKQESIDNSSHYLNRGIFTTLGGHGIVLGEHKILVLVEQVVNVLNQNGVRIQMQNLGNPTRTGDTKKGRQLKQNHPPCYSLNIPITDDANQKRKVRDSKSERGTRDLVNSATLDLVIFRHPVRLKPKNVDNN